jgi:hypothetical protein
MNGLSWFRLLALSAFAIVLQVSVLNEINVLGAHADLMIVIAAAGGVVAGPARGAMIGFVAGCLSDLTVALPFGFGPLTFVLVGFGSNYLLRAASGRDIPVAELSTTVIAAVAGTVLYALIAAAIGQPGMLGPALVRAALLVAGGSILFGFVVLRATRWVVEPSATAIGGIGAG